MPCLRPLSSPKIRPFVINHLLLRFIAGIKQYQSNAVVSDRLESVVHELSRGHGTPLFTISEASFASAFLSPWEENNRVDIYLYRRSDAKPGSPGIIMPGFIEGSPMTRAATLLLLEEGWTVLEVAMPFFGQRTVPITQHQDRLSQRYAALKLTPADFCGYIEQAADDIRKAALWFLTLPFIDSERVAIWGFSFAASAALTAFATTSVLTHAIGLCPPVDWAQAIWTAQDQGAYLAFLQSIGVSREQFNRIVSPFQLDKLRSLEDRRHRSKIFYVSNDPYTSPSLMKSIAERFRMLTPFEADGSQHDDPHITGLLPYFASIVEGTVNLVTRT